GDGALARSGLQPTAPALGHRHAEPRRLRGAVLGSPRSGLTPVSTRPGQDHPREPPPTPSVCPRRGHGQVATILPTDPPPVPSVPSWSASACSTTWGPRRAADPSPSNGSSVRTTRVAEALVGPR